MWKEDSLIVTTVHPNEIVPRRGPPSVFYEESDKKVNQSYCQLTVHRALKASSHTSEKGAHTLKPSTHRVKWGPTP